MIPTWLHGVIDWTVAGALGRLAASRSLSPPVRAALGSAAAYQTSYAFVTDYEGGARPWLTMRQHLVLDALGGTALLGAGITMRRQPTAQRALLVAVGLLQLAVVARSDSAAGAGRGGGAAAHNASVTYPPLDTPRPVADHVFVVESALPGLMGKVLPVRMTVIRLPNGDLLLHSPTRYSDTLRCQLQGLGRIAHLLAPNIAHWQFLSDWQRACPDATTWAAPGLRARSQVRRSGLRLDNDLSETAPAAWGGAVSLVIVPGGMGFHEVALFHPASETLVLTDLVVNLEPGKLPAIMRPVFRLFGSTAPDGMPPPYLRAVIKLRRPAASRAALRLLDLQPERVIFAHGRWFETDGTESLRRSLRWLLT